MAILSQTIYTSGFISSLFLADSINVNPPYLVYNELGNYFTPQNGNWTITSVDFYMGRYILGPSTTPIVCKIYGCAGARGIPTVEVATSTTILNPSELSGTGTGWTAGAWETFEFESSLLNMSSTYVVTLKCDTSLLDGTKDLGTVWVFPASATVFSPSYYNGYSQYNTYSSSWTVGAAGAGGLYYRLNGTESLPGAPDTIPQFPPDRPVMDIPDPWWDPPDPPVPPTPPGPSPPYWTAGGGSYQKNLVVAGNNKIYYEPHTANTVRYTV